MLLIGIVARSQNPQGVVAATNIRNAKYPLILPDHRVVFSIRAPDARRVEIDLGKKYDLVKDAAGNWSATTDSIGEGFHYYTLFIDGVAVADPASESFYGMGRMASGIEIPFKGGDYYALKDVPHGEISIKHYYSAVTGSWRNLYIYTPPGYGQSSNQKYPVLYILHGGGEDERGWAMQGKADLILDNLIAEKKAKPMLVVMPDANMPVAGFGEQGLKAFEQEMESTIMPFVDKNYNTENTAKSRALAGLSMGGINTLYTGLYHTNLFSYLGVFSSGWIVPAQNELANAQYQFLASNGKKVNDDLRVLFVSDGDKDDIAYRNCKAMLAKFDLLKINYTYYEYPGGHTWPVWRNDLLHFAPLLFR
ncbi:esterase [Mucilaginibacter sp. PPCGB 2223]|nr:esterase [Mucilaginibacter sp. PPCGB 2223]